MIKFSKYLVVMGVFTTGLALAPASGAWPSLSGLMEHKSSSNADLGTSQQALITDFVGSQREVLQAQALLERAYGFKDKAELLQAQQKALSSGPVDENSLKKTVELSRSANKQIAAEQAKQGALTSQEKAAYTASLPHFADGVIGTTKTVTAAQNFASSAESGGGGLAGMVSGADKLKVGLYIAKVTPAYSKELYSVFKKTVMIGRKNGVTIPANATNALGSLTP
jgi:hypothetical protein